MKQPQLDSDFIRLNINKPNINYKHLIKMVFVVFLIISSCKNDLERIKSFSEEDIIPTLSGKDITIYRSDSGNVNIKITSPEIKRFDQHEEPYLEFPKGLDVFFLDSAAQVKTHISSKYAIYYEQQKLWFARDSVVAMNVIENESITSEEMYWNEDQRRVYSDKFTTVVKKDGTYHGRKGFEAKQDFSSWKLKQMYGKGIITEKNEE